MIYSSLTTVALILSALTTFTTAAPALGYRPAQVCAYLTPPPKILRNGATNPFYPCGATRASVANCPYRCYTAGPAPSLLDQCFDAPVATSLIASLKFICVACTVPSSAEIPTSIFSTPVCAPLQYLNSTPSEPGTDVINSPSRCGTFSNPDPECAWSCGEAEVPFSLCSATDNSTHPLESCSKCLPQCSSPSIVFDPPTVPTNFSISKGNCSQSYGPQETVACPWRCMDVGNPNAYCSLVDLPVADHPFTNCTSCL